MNEQDIPMEARKKMDRQVARSFEILEESDQKLPDDPSAWIITTRTKKAIPKAVSRILNEAEPIPDF